MQNSHTQLLRNSVVQIWSKETPSHFLGTGFFVYPRSSPIWILTCSHLVLEPSSSDIRPADSLSIHWRGERRQVERVATQPQLKRRHFSDPPDIALIKIQGSFSTDSLGLPFANEDVRPFSSSDEPTEVYVYGFYERVLDDLTAFTTRIRSRDYMKNWWLLDSINQKGLSGSPIITQGDTLMVAGMVSCRTEDKLSVGIPSSIILSWIDTISELLPDLPVDLLRDFNLDSNSSEHNLLSVLSILLRSPILSRLSSLDNVLLLKSSEIYELVRMRASIDKLREHSPSSAFDYRLRLLSEVLGRIERTVQNEVFFISENFSLREVYIQYGVSLDAFIKALPKRVTKKKWLRAPSAEEEIRREVEIANRLSEVISSECEINEPSPPGHHVSLLDDAIEEANLFRHKLINIFGRSWLGDGAFALLMPNDDNDQLHFPFRRASDFADTSTNYVPAAGIVPRDHLFKMYGTACAIGFQVEAICEYDRVVLDSVFVEVTSYRPLPKYELNLPAPFESAHVFVVEPDDPATSGTGHFESKFTVDENGVQKLGKVVLRSSDVEYIVIRINPKKEGIYTFDCGCWFSTRQEKELVWIFKGCEYLFYSK